MKLLYDHQVMASQVYGGISRYFFELMGQFYDMRNPDFVLSLIYSKNHFLNEAAAKNRNYYFRKPGFHFRFRDKAKLNIANSIKALSAEGFDLFHPTYYDPYFLDYLNGKPFVLTVYDMIHERFAGQYSSRDKTAEQKKCLLSKAHRILAISENTKKDILHYYPQIDESRVVVTYLASSLDPLDARKPSRHIPPRYILYVGSRGLYKNFQTFIAGARDILVKDRDLHVICAGSEPFKPAELEMVSGWGIHQQVHYIPVEDNDLAWLYAHAMVFIFPSLYEGFGIPALEAFACGCPLVCSNVSSLPEVAGNAAEYIDPQSQASVRQAIEKVIYNERLRLDMTARGYEQLRLFSWQKTALKTREIYRDIV